MSSFIKFALILILCTVTLLIFVNIVERKNIDEGFGDGPSTNPKFLDSHALPENSASKKLLNLKNFEYTIQPVLCSSKLLTWIVTSYAADPAPRSALRRAYPIEELKKIGITRIFLLGMLDDSTQKKSGIVQKAIKNEADRFGDIVQGNFYEAYRNLTYKHLMGLKWATENCQNAPYIMKQDDDIVINLYEIIEKLEKLEPKNEVFAGYVLRGMKPVREPANKWFVSNDEFAADDYPDFLSGWLYVISREVASRLVEGSNGCKNYFWIDDVFLTGIIRRELNLGLYDLRSMYTTDYRYLECCIKGMRKNLKCEFAVGPNGGKIDLQMDFQKFAQFCRRGCANRETRLSVAQTCVSQYEESKVKIGSARIDPIKLL